MTTVLTTKWTCDASGNWREVPVILTRTPDGWTEQPASEAEHKRNRSEK